MKTPYYPVGSDCVHFSPDVLDREGCLDVKPGEKQPVATRLGEHAYLDTNLEDILLREARLKRRLANRDDVRDITIVTAPAIDIGGTCGAKLFRHASDKSKTNLSWAMHWAIKVGDQYFELQRAHTDPTRTGLRMSKWSEEQECQIINRYPQGVTALTDQEIKAVGDSQFSKLNRMHLNKYAIWSNNCQVAVDNMLCDIGGLSQYRTGLKSLTEFTRQFFCESMLMITRLYYQKRGCDQEVIAKHERILTNTLEILTSRSIHYPKRRWIQEDIDVAKGFVGKMSVVKDHWCYSILESSLSLRKRTEFSYFERGTDGKPALKMDLVAEAVKGIWDDNDKLVWLKALPWLTAGFVVGTPRWAFAVVYLASQRMIETFVSEDDTGLKGGIEASLVGIGASPKLLDSEFTSSKGARRRCLEVSGIAKRSKSNALAIGKHLVERYERRLTRSGVPYFLDHIHHTKTWDAPDRQEMYLRISDIPLPKRWKELRQEDGTTSYVNFLTGEIRNTRPGLREVWALKRRLTADWVKSTIIPLPGGWELRRTAEGEKYYVNHNVEPSTSTIIHPMRQEIEDERHLLLLEDWNVEWDEDHGKKYRNLLTGEIRWKARDGPKYSPYNAASVAPSTLPPQSGFTEPLPTGWELVAEEDGRKVYIRVKDKIRRTTHPNHDKRRRLLPVWEMRYTQGGRRYWIHYGKHGRGSTWWTRNKLVKNTTLKNNACGWKLDEKGIEWEWFEGGDVAHTDIPVLDLDDPAGFEVREYPDVSRGQLTSFDNTFIEPLPPDWVSRRKDNGEVYYFNFKKNACSDQHPYENERKNLPALWEMRWTKHGRHYFVHHRDGLTWWTHPRVDRQGRKLRGLANEKQDGWRLCEKGQMWIRFQESPESPLTDSEMSSPLTLPMPSNNSPSITDDAEIEETRRTLVLTQEWLNEITSNDFFIRAAKSIKLQSNLGLMNASQLVKDYTNELGDNERLADMRQWIKDRGANESMGTVAQRMGFRRNSSRKQDSGTSKDKIEDLVGRDADEQDEEGDDARDLIRQDSKKTLTDNNVLGEFKMNGFRVFMQGLKTKQGSDLLGLTDSVHDDKTGGNGEIGVQHDRTEPNDPGTDPSEDKADGSSILRQMTPGSSDEGGDSDAESKAATIVQRLQHTRKVISRHASDVLARTQETLEEKRLAREQKRDEEKKLAEATKVAKAEALAAEKALAIERKEVKKQVAADKKKVAKGKKAAKRFEKGDVGGVASVVEDELLVEGISGRQ